MAKRRPQYPSVLNKAAPAKDGGEHRLRMLKVLFQHYGISFPTDSDAAWFQLALSLAADHIAAFRPAGKRGAPRKWSYAECREYVAAVDAHLTGAQTLKGAIAEAEKSPLWRQRRTASIDGLAVRYREAKAAIAAANALYRRYREIMYPALTDEQISRSIRRRRELSGVRGAAARLLSSTDEN
ncbi:MAG: hypothetical protein GEU91_13610 [Rhizobiales bacterium]|nr:hypothetical protein [Hyphomicrobiales bacterium]